MTKVLNKQLEGIRIEQENFRVKRAIHRGEIGAEIHRLELQIALSHLADVCGRLRVEFPEVNSFVFEKSKEKSISGFDLFEITEMHFVSGYTSWDAERWLEEELYKEQMDARFSYFENRLIEVVSVSNWEPADGVGLAVDIVYGQV